MSDSKTEFGLEEILRAHNFVFIDCCTINSVSSKLSRDLYEASYLTKLPVFLNDLIDLRNSLKQFKDCFQKYNNGYIIPKIREEMLCLHRHLTICFNRHQKQLDPFIERCSQKKAFRSSHFRGDNIRGHTKWFNRKLEKGKKEIFTESKEDTRSHYQKPLTTLNECADILYELIDSLNIYNTETILPNRITKKASANDAYLVTAFLKYEQEHNQEKGAIITRDGDILDLISLYGQIEGLSLPDFDVYFGDKKQFIFELYTFNNETKSGKTATTLQVN